MKLLILVLLTLFAINAFGETKPIYIAVGEQTYVELKSTGNIQIINSRPVKVEIRHKKLHIMARQTGSSQINIGSQAIKIIVYASTLKGQRERILSWLNKTIDLDMTTLPKKIVISGIVHRESDWIQIQKFKSEYKNTLEIQAEPDSQLLNILSNQTQSDTVVLKPMIEIDVNIAEMKKNVLREFGLKLPQNFSATVLPSGDLSSASTTFNPLNFSLQNSEYEGRGRVIANPKLLCRSGDAAHFVAGGEVPIKIMNWKTSDVIWKKYGVLLDITPIADTKGAIQTKITTEISLIDEAHKVDGIPGFLTNRIETQFNIRNSQTIALSGLIRSDQGKGLTSSPGISDIPILGELFKSKDFKEQRTELIIFVTPKVILENGPSKTPSWIEDEW